MASVYDTLQAIWRMTPYSLRARVYYTRPLNGLREAVNRFCPGRHQRVWDESYYRYIDETAIHSSTAMSDSITKDLCPKTVLDIGCGTGALLETLQSRGIDAAGIDYSDACLKRCRERGLYVRKFNITRDAVPHELSKRDVVISFEVAEHLPARFADVFVDLLCRASDVVVLSAATPGQGGRDHVNEQPHEYWIQKFDRRGYSFDRELSLAWRSNWKERGVARWYCNNVMIFRRNKA